MYTQVETSSQITMSKSGVKVSPVATLKDQHGGVCEIIEDDHCYLICLKQQDGTFSEATYIFQEALIVLRTLPDLKIT